MNTERFEALIDAILAIIITIIVLEIPIASTGTWESLFELKYEFLIYAISFMICFNFWNYNNNIFNLVNNIDYKVIWCIGFTLFVFSLLPYLTIFVAENFYSFFAQFVYGLLFIVTASLSIITSKFLKNADKSNNELQIALKSNSMLISTIILVLIGFVIGYFIYPPIIIIFCLISIVMGWIMPNRFKSNFLHDSH